MFLHAATLAFQHPVSGAMLSVSVPLPAQLDQLLKQETLIKI